VKSSASLREVVTSFLNSISRKKPNSFKETLMNSTQNGLEKLKRFLQLHTLIQLESHTPVLMPLNSSTPSSGTFNHS
jgi:hypothetical protein